MKNNTTSAGSASLIGLLTIAAGCASEEEVTLRETTTALTAEQCEFFEVEGKVQLCHRTSSTTKPYTIVRTSVEGCAEGHALHEGDYVAYNDPTCNGQGCYPEGAPYDGSAECCEGLTPVNGVCTNACGPSGTRTLDVFAGAFPYVDSGVVLRPGCSATVTATGDWYVGAAPVYGTSFDANGSTNPGIESCARDTSSRMGALVASIDGGVQWTFAGVGPTTFTNTTGADTSLLFVQNDCPCDIYGSCYSDNSGTIQVTVSY